MILDRAVSLRQHPVRVGQHEIVEGLDALPAQQLVEVASLEACAVSAVQATRESLLPYYGTIGGRRVAGQRDLYEVETVIEKPTPTEAELRKEVIREEMTDLVRDRPTEVAQVLRSWLVEEKSS